TEAYPVPRPDDVQEHLGNAKYFTTLDLRSGYWQVPVRPEDQAKTAFCPGPGFPLYEWLRMPFGLASAPATFQRLMDSLVGDLPFVKCYLDDLLIFSSSLEEHLAHLRQVFELLRAAGLTIAAEKCAIAETSVDYLGHTFGPSGMTPDIKKVETILRWPVPGSVPELRSFLGLANYYRGFLPHFSERTRPLYELLTESIKLKTSALLPWTDTCEAAMVDVKENLARLPLLTYPDFTRPFQLITDASDVAIGGVLEQDGAPLSFFSQALTSTQRRWPVYEREAFAIFRSLERFRNLLLGYPLELIVFTDHKPLTFLETSTTPKVQRWMLSLCQYSFSIQYRPGKDNVVADALSRLPSARSDMDIEQPEPPVHPAAMLAPVCLGSGLVHQLDMEVLKKEQFADSDLRRVMKRLFGERSDDRDERFSLYAARLLEFSLEDGVLMYTREVCDGRQPRVVPVIPSSLKDRMLYEAHELQGHQGLQATRRWLQSRCYWLDMEDDVRLHLYCCSKCFPSTTDSEGEEPYRPAMMATLASFVLDDSSARPVVAGNVSGVRPVIPSALVTASEEWSKEDIRLRQDEDDVIRLVKERLRDQQPFGRAAMRDPLFRPYRKLWSVLFLDDSDLLVRMVKYLPDDEKSYVPVIPESLRKPLLYKFHDLGGHFGKQHMWDRMRRLCFWPGMNVDITDYVAQCDRCLTIKARQQPASALVPFPVGAPWHTIAVDFLFVGPSNEGSTKLLVIVDHFTRWADAYVVKGEGSIDALAPLLQLFSQFGPPARILSDQGPGFESDVFCNALKILGISK
ncbi:hypothetical protein FOZ63_000946, partial [Perkinsus olseni]